MKDTAAGWTARERALLALCVLALGISIAGYLDLGGNAGAAPNFGSVGTTVDSSEIRNNTIRPRDIRRVNTTDLGIYVREGTGFRVDPGGTSGGHAICDPGDRAIAGGFNAGTTLDVFHSRPLAVGGSTELNSWFVAVRNEGNNALSAGSIAVCMNG